MGIVQSVLLVIALVLVAELVLGERFWGYVEDACEQWLLG